MDVVEEGGSTVDEEELHNLDDTNNPSDSDESLDMFKDSDCGEPFVEQHIVLDFTPTEEDTDFIQDKCCAFWDFVNSQPELDGMIPVPDSDTDIPEKVSESGDYVSVQDQSRPSISPKIKEKTAVSMLELVEQKGLIDRAFSSKLPTSHCSLRLTEYQDKGETLDPTNVQSAKKKILAPCLCYSTAVPIEEPEPIAKSAKLPRLRDGQHPSASSAVRAMCQKLQEWDLEHPKSMDPPGAIPDLENKMVEKKISSVIQNCPCINKNKI